jgi:hypothetical protein
MKSAGSPKSGWCALWASVTLNNATRVTNPTPDANIVRPGEGLPTGNSDYFWHLPNIYFGDYLEVSTSADEIEGPLSWRDFEFQVKNPEGGISDWVPFTYAFDDEMLDKVRRDSLQGGTELLVAGKAADAIEPLRKAYVFADRMLGVQHEETLRVKTELDRARDEAALARLRFRVGDRLAIFFWPS